MLKDVMDSIVLNNQVYKVLLHCAQLHMAGGMYIISLNYIIRKNN